MKNSLVDFTRNPSSNAMMVNQGHGMKGSNNMRA